MGKNDTRISRRDMLKTGALAGAGAVFASGGFQKAVAGGGGQNQYTLYGAISPAMTKWTEQLISAIPAAALAPTQPYPNCHYYEITSEGGRWLFHTQLPVTSPKRFTTWGYRSSNFFIGYLGPTIEAKTGIPVVVKYTNNLPSYHPVQQAIDPTVPEAEIYGVMPGGRITPHLHGGFAPPQFDGHPHSWFSKRGEHGTHYATLGTPLPNEAIYYYPNDQLASQLWYHDHAMGVTRLNAYVGLAALYFIRDAVTGDTGLANNAYGFPAGAYEVPLVLQDKTFNIDGSLFYPTMGVTIDHPIWMPEFFGDTPVINGKCYPNFNIEPRRYRFRIVNGSQARFYNLSIPMQGRGNLPIWVIGSEQSLLPAAKPVQALLISPGERFDIIVDFTGMAVGSKFTLKNNANAPFPGGGGGPNIPELMQFTVVALTTPDTTRLPSAMTSLIPVVPLTPTAPAREIVLAETMAPAIAGGPPAPTHVLLNERFFDSVDPITGFLTIDEAPAINSIEQWQYLNTTADTHPMHSHLVAFQVVNRQAFNSAAYLAAYTAWVLAGRVPATKPLLQGFLAGAALPPTPEETGWKDTVKCPPGQVTRVVAEYKVPIANPNIVGTDTTLPAQYVYHCHILEHEENEMMRTLCVTSNGQPPTNLPPNLWKPGATPASVPTEFALEQNYPNPFNPETTIRFQLPEDSDVQLKIFNSLGQEVETLVNQVYTAGAHSVKWDGSKFASGVYYAKIKAGSFASSMKMMLVK